MIEGAAVWTRETIAPARGYRVGAGALAGLLVAAITARWLATADHILAEDPFVIIESAKHLLATGEYRIPALGSADAVLRWAPPSWPVGFPLLLASLFSVFGPSEEVARAATIVISALVAPLTAVLASVLFARRFVTLAAGALAAIHPLAVAFGGQVFTNNLSATLFAGALCALIAATVRRDRSGFESIRDVVAEPRRVALLSAAALFVGMMLAVRDTDVILLGPVAYVLYQCRVFTWQFLRHDLWRCTPALAAAAFLIGWAPSLYFNTVNFGSPFVSTHYQTGIRLNAGYLLNGSDFFFGLPGAAVMAISLAVWQFPLLLALPALRSAEWSARVSGAMTLLICAAILLVNGAFPVASTGAAPRYLVPLVPFACLFAARAFERASLPRLRTASRIVGVTVAGWLAILTYPPPALFQIWPRFVYLTYYSPAYVGHPYRNYPDHTNAMVQWVRANTPPDAVIVTPSRAQHFYYYGRRDVVVFDPPILGEWTGFVGKRPLYLVEDRTLAAQPGVVAQMRRNLSGEGLQLSPVGSVRVFTPEAGDRDVRAYLISRNPGVDVPDADLRSARPTE